MDKYVKALKKYMKEHAKALYDEVVSWFP